MSDENPNGNVPPTNPPLVVSTDVPLGPVALPVNYSEKPEKFNGTEFKRWQMKMMFYLTTLRLSMFLFENAPTLAEDETDVQVRIAYDDWKNSDYLCRNYILNGLVNALYNVYCTAQTAKELWLTLEKKYVSEDAGMKKFVVGRFLYYKMIDTKSVMAQSQELQVLLHEIHTEGMILNQSFQVAAIIWKLPPLWKDFKKKMKHKCKEMKMEDLMMHIRMEENTMNLDKKAANHYDAKANMVEQENKAAASEP